MTWSLTAGPTQFLASDGDNGGFANIDNTYGFWASGGQNEIYRLAYPGTLGTGATLDSLNVSIYEPKVHLLNSTHALVTWIGETGGPVDTAVAIVQLSNPPTVGSFATGLYAAVGETHVSIPLSTLRALAANANLNGGEIGLFDLNTATNAASLNGSTAAHGLTGDPRAIEKLDSNDGILVGDGTPGEAIVCQTGTGSLVLGTLRTLTANIDAVAAYLAPIDSTHVLLSYRDTSYKVVVLTISGTIVTDGTPVTITGPAETPRLVRIGAGSDYGLIYTATGGAGVKFRTVSVSGTTVTDNSDVIGVASSSYSVMSAGYFTDGSDNVYIVLNDGSDNSNYAIVSQVTASALKFYSGTNGLTYRSDLPFTTINNPACAVARESGEVFVGAAAAGGGGELVVSGSGDDDYAAWTDITGSLTDPVNGLADV